MELGSMARFKRAELPLPVIEAMQKQLFFKQKSGKKYGFGPGQVLNLFREIADWMDVPRQFGITVAKTRGLAIADNTIEGAPVSFNFIKTLRPDLDQPNLTSDFLGKIASTHPHGGIFSAPCGTGKTIMTLYMLSKIGRPALILVHNAALVKQWRESMFGGKDTPAFTDLKPHEVGHIQQDVCDWYGRKVVVAMIESLVAREYEPEMYKNFGVVVADEVHLHGAAEWHKAMNLFPSRLRIGLSATPRRADGLWDVVRLNVGEVLTQGKMQGKAKVFAINTGIEIPESNFGGKLTFLIGILAQHEYRNRLVAEEAVKAVKAGRRALILSHRREQLNTLRDMIAQQWGDVPGLNIGWYVGGISNDQIDLAKTCNLLLGTYQYAKVGLDDPGMDTLFLATPSGDVEQPAGRILRSIAGKKEPLIVDFVDDKTKLCKGFGDSRERQYVRLGFDFCRVERNLVPEQTAIDKSGLHG